MRYQALFLFAAGAAVAAPVANQQYGGQQQDQKDWPKVWADQLASMKSVQDAMGKHSPTDAPKPKPGGYEAPPAPKPYEEPKPPKPSEPEYQPPSQPEPEPEKPQPEESEPEEPEPEEPEPEEPSTGGGAGPRVTNPKAFESGAGCKAQDLSGPTAHDSYKCYGKTADTMPSKDKWASFDSLWEGSQKLMKTACSNLGYGKDNTDEQNEWIAEKIKLVAKDSLVDARFILAVIMQESHGCLNVGTTNNGVGNPGLMQSHEGVTFCGADKPEAEQKKSIEQMIRDGVQGTIGKPNGGEGLVQGINKYGDIYAAARKYNSGSCEPSNLNNAFSSTGTYVQSIANRMTGYVQSPPMEPKCPGETGG